MSQFDSDPWAAADDMWSPTSSTGGSGYIPPAEDHDKGGSWIDKALMLDPTKGFKESWLDSIYGPDSPATAKKGDSTWTTLGRAGLSVLFSPVALMAAAGGELMDTLAYGPWGVTEHHTVEEAKHKKAETKDKDKGDLIPPPTDKIPT